MADSAGWGSSQVLHRMDMGGGGGPGIPGSDSL